MIRGARAALSMAATFVALIRGINVGRAKRVAMADLRALVERLGFSEARTLLNSGNVVFAGPRATEKTAPRRIEEALASDLGVPARVTVLTADELDRAVRENPLLDLATDPSRLLVCVLAEARARSKLKPLLAQKWKPEAIAVGARAAYLWCPDGITKSPLNETVTRALGDGVTARNWATVLKLQALVRCER